ncbi:MAG: hypothetical protein JW860_09705, partial [Sedimentisphaerales bacterium]|nr:hypothetical protein [Sedimentisphaerales bacterium]
GKGKKCKATVTFPGDFPEDDYTLIVLLDSSDDVDESDESNNMGTSDGIFHVLAAMTDCCSDELSLVGTWAVSAIQGAPGKVNAANSTWTFYENGTYAWFLYYQGYYDLDEYGSYTLSEDILTVNSDSIMAVILGSESTPITLKKDNFTFRDEDNDKWTYVKME